MYSFPTVDHLVPEKPQSLKAKKHGTINIKISRLASLTPQH